MGSLVLVWVVWENFEVSKLPVLRVWLLGGERAIIGYTDERVRIARKWTWRRT